MKRASLKSGVPVGLLVTLIVTLVCSTLPRPAAGRVIPLREVPPSVNTVEGLVEVSSDDGKTWTPVTPGMHISAGQILRTSSDGTVVLDSSDGTVVALQPLSTIVPLPDDRSLRLLIFAGSVWVQYASVADGDRNGVSAPRVTAAGLEPCTFVLDLVELATTVKVLEGRVGLQHESTGDTSDVVAGEAASATPTGFQPESDFDPDAERALWEPLLSGTTTTSIPEETTSTSTGRTTSTLTDTGTNPPPADDSGTSSWTRWGIVLIVAAAVLFLALIAAATVLLVVLGRRRPPYSPAPGPQPPRYGPAAGPDLQRASPAGPGAPAPPPAAFCRHCGAGLTSGARFCRSCGKAS